MGSRLPAIATIVSIWAAGPAHAAISRQEVFLDGDAAVPGLFSEDVLLTRVDPARPTVEFGSAAVFGDVNGDGIPDAIIGQRADNRVFVYLGTAAPRAASWFGDPNAADIVIEGTGAASGPVQQFGFSVASIDVDRDGYDDILVGAPFSDPGGVADAGVAFVLLSAGGLAAGQQFSVGLPPAGVAVIELTRGGARAGDKLGFAVGAGDLPGSQDAYVVVTARDADAPAPQSRADAGSAHIVLGSRLPAMGGPYDLSGGSDATIYGDDASDAFGEAVATCDIDGAGDDDLIVGAIFGDGPANGGLNRGEAIVLLGENLASGLPSGAASASDADMIVHGAGDGDDLGFSVACGDLDGDGRGEIVLGAIFADGAHDARITSGEVYVLRGREAVPDPGGGPRLVLIDPDANAPQGPVDLSIAVDPNAAIPVPAGADLAIHGSTAADQLGFSLAVGDFDGDGAGDLAAGARRYDRDQTLVNVGAAYVILGAAGFLGPATSAPRAIDLHDGTARTLDPGYDPNTPVDHLPDDADAIVVGASRDDHAAFVLAAGDLNGDGGDDLLIGAIGDLTRAPGFPGEAYLVSFSDRDGDGASDLLDTDSDNDGLADQDEVDGVMTGGAPTDPFDPDTDGDGIQDGTELGLTCAGGGGVVEIGCDDPASPFTATDPALPLFFVPDADPATVTDPLDPDSDDDALGDGLEDDDGDGAAGPGETDAADQDSDDDGLPDGWIDGAHGMPADGMFQPLEGEDADADGVVDIGETDPGSHDTDTDGLSDGLELGVTAALADTDLSAGHFTADADAGSTTTSPLDLDTDDDGLRDGVEDANGDGAADAGETDPLDQDSDDDGLGDGAEDVNGDGARAPAESSPVDHDTDKDGLFDGLERGVTSPLADTDLPAGHFAADADAGATTTAPWDADTDDDGLPDGFIDGYNPNGGGQPGGIADGVASVYEGEDLDLDGMKDPGETDPSTFDTDGDGVRDGVERGVLAPGVIGPDLAPDPATGGVQDGTKGGPTTLLDTDDTTLTDALDGDDDEDGLSDGAEDLDGDGFRDPAESDPTNPDTDGDLVLDGTEAGLATPQPDTDTGAGFWVPDADAGATTTDRADADTDNGGATDGEEDADRNGRIDAGERDPNERRDDDRSGVLEFTETLNGTVRTTPFAPGETIFLRLDDDLDENLDPAVAEVVTVSCVSTGTGSETEVPALTAVAPDSGLFAGSIVTSGSVTAPNDGVLTVMSGGSVTCMYVDAQDAVDTRSAALSAALAGGGAPEPAIEMSPTGEVHWFVPGALVLPAGMTVNLYRGDPATLRATGVYTQVAVACGLAATAHDDGVTPAPGGVLFYLAAGVVDGVEGSIGADSAGGQRPSSGACGS